MFWNQVAGIYDLFVNVVNRKTHTALKQIIAQWIEPGDKVLECACGTGMLTQVIAQKAASVTATDYASKMLKQAEKNCRACTNIIYRQADILALSEEDDSYDKVVAGNVIHLLDEPYKALAELDRVCRPGGVLIIPTYMNKDKGKTNSFVSTVGKAGADFKRQFTIDTYKLFFLDAGYSDVSITLADGRIPCAVAVMHKKQNRGHSSVLG